MVKTGYCAARHLFYPPSPHSLLLSACHYSPSFRGEGERRQEWRTGKVTRGLTHKQKKKGLISIFVELQAQAAAGSCSPSNQEKRMKAVMWQHRLILIIICFSISSGTPYSFAQKCFSNRLPTSFHAIMLCNLILAATLSHYFQICFVSV